MSAVDRFLYLVSRVLARLSRERIRLFRYYIVAQPTHNPLSDSKPRRSRFAIRCAGALDAVIESAPRPRAVFEQRLRNGAVCVVAEYEGQLAGFIWIAERAYMEDEVRCLYELDSRAKAAWDFDVYVAPTHRMTRLFEQLWRAASEELRGRGYQWTFSRISGFNASSLAAHRRLGALVVGCATFLVIGPVQVSYFSSPRRIHVAFSQNSYPIVKLPPEIAPFTTCDTRRIP